MVEWTHAESLFKYIRSTGGLYYTVPKSTDGTEVCVEMNPEGKKQVVVGPKFQTFQVQTPPKALVPILKNWIRDLDRAP